MMDIVKKNGDKINIEELSRELGCKVVEISALKGTGIKEAADAAVEAAKNGKTVPMHTFMISNMIIKIIRIINVVKHLIFLVFSIL